MQTTFNCFFVTCSCRTWRHTYVSAAVSWTVLHYYRRNQKAIINSKKHIRYYSTPEVLTISCFMQLNLAVLWLKYPLQLLPHCVKCILLRCCHSFTCQIVSYSFPFRYCLDTQQFLAQMDLFLIETQSVFYLRFRHHYNNCFNSLL